MSAENRIYKENKNNEIIMKQKFISLNEAFMNPFFSPFHELLYISFQKMYCQDLYITHSDPLYPVFKTFSVTCFYKSID